jgi:hypothetical protein
MAESSRTLFSEPWGKHFSSRISEQGERLTVTAVFSDTTAIYLLDQADRSIAILDLSGAFIRRVPLESAGRQNYVGDDFVVRRNQALVLNAVDRQIAVFDLSSGALLRSLPYPAAVLANEPKRSHRIINRIFLNNGRIALGNSFAIINLDESLAKTDLAAKALKPPQGAGFILFDGRATITRQANGSMRDGRATFAAVKSPVPMLGKQYFRLRDKNFAITIDANGIRIVEAR